MLKLAVVGSRTFTDYQKMCEVLDAHERPFTLVSGGARGTDNLAERYASEHHLTIKIIHADWNAHGKTAGFLRNTKIVEESDDCIAFWDGQSRGTQDTIKKFREMKGIFPLIIEV